jgi:tRNA threonylcarbamoyladenosine biosynthesis protein TsaB
MNARLLAFDTSTEVLSVALHDGHTLHTRNEAGGSIASTRLVPVITELLARGALSYRELDAIAFGCGPGAFTGVRTSCAVAQGLAFGAGKPVVAVDSLLVVAEDARAQLGAHACLELAVAMDARMNQVYAARYRHDGQGWHTVQAPVLLDGDQLPEAWRGLRADALAGSAWRAFGERLASLPGQRIDEEADRAAALMRVAQQRWKEGTGLDPAQAMPVYLRDKVALTTAERDAERAAKAAAA